jgi:hypothetical protein
MIDLLLTQLQLKLPNHTYRAVKLHSEELGELEKNSYLEGILRDRERSEGAGE